MLAAALCLAAGSAGAADLAGTAARICLTSWDSDIVSLDRPALTKTLQHYRDDAAAAAKDKSVVYSRSTAFDWAVATTVQCNVALGYLKGGHVDEVSSEKCDCFHSHLLALGAIS